MSNSKTTEHKEGKARVKVVYFTSKTLADGSHPFVVRITKDRKQVYRYTGLSLLPKFWNKDKQEVRRSYPEPQREALLKELRKWEEKYSEAAETLAAGDERHSAETVFAKAIEGRKATRRVMLLAYIEEVAVGMKAVGQVGNAGVYRDLGNQLAKFIRAEYNVADIPFAQVTVGFCNEWEGALRATGAAEITLSLRFRTLRAVLNKAIANGVAKAEVYPFARTVADQHKFSVGKFDVSTTKRAISRAAIRKLEAFVPTTARHHLAKNVFLFSFYCGGINFVDLGQLRWHNLESINQDYRYRLNYTRQKTGSKFSLKLIDPAEAIADYYHPYARYGPDSYLFPILDVMQHKTPTQIKNRLHKVLGQVNKDLKAIAAEIGIDTSLTTYVARHSFATSLKKDGATVGMISEAMGHKSEAVTTVYLDAFDTEVLDSVYDRLL